MWPFLYIRKDGADRSSRLADCSICCNTYCYLNISTITFFICCSYNVSEVTNCTYFIYFPPSAKNCLKKSACSCSKAGLRAKAGLPVIRLLVLLAIIYLIGGGKSQMDFGGSFFPDITKLDNLVLASGIFLFYAGMEMTGIHVKDMEMTGIHVKDMENPSRNYPRAVFMGAIITVLIFVLGTFALGIVIPQKDINLTQSLLVGFDNYFKFVGASWLSPVIAVALAFGVLAGVLTWVSGPSKGIFAVGKAGYLPPFMQKSNKIGVQKNILLIQGALVTVLSLLFVIMPSVQSFYQILSQLTVLLYLIMYLLMFAAAIYLRYSMKDTPRPFRLGKKGNCVMWIVSGVGFLGSLLAFVLSFIPPAQIAVGSNATWYSVLIIGGLVVVVAPFIIYAMRKPHWVDKESQFEPFHDEKQ